MPNPMPFFPRLAIVLVTLAIPTAAFANTATEEAPRAAQERPSLGLRVGGAAYSILGGGLGGLLGTQFNSSDMITVGIPLGDSGWRIEPGVFGSYSTSEVSSTSSLTLSVMPQRILTSHKYGAVYLGVALGVSGTRSRSSQADTDNEIMNSFYSLSAQPLLGVQGLLGDALGIGFEVGPTLTHTPESTANLGNIETTSLAWTEVRTRANLTIKYHFR